jgi:putative SOS response-associated peptidase YedK
MSAIHHRLPLILEKNQWGFWLGEKGHGASALMTPTDDKILTAYKVSPAINSNKSLGPELITPI